MELFVQALGGTAEKNRAAFECPIAPPGRFRDRELPFCFFAIFTGYAVAGKNSVS